MPEPTTTPTVVVPLEDFLKPIIESVDRLEAKIDAFGRRLDCLVVTINRFSAAIEARGGSR